MRDGIADGEIWITRLLDFLLDIGQIRLSGCAIAYSRLDVVSLYRFISCTRVFPLYTLLSRL